MTSSTLGLVDDFLRINNTAELLAFRLTTIGGATFQQRIVSTPLIKHIPRSGHSMCDNLLVEIFQKINSNTSSVKSWSVLLNHGILISVKLLRTDSKQYLISIIKRKVQDFLYDIPTVVCTSKKHKPQFN